MALRSQTNTCQPARAGPRARALLGRLTRLTHHMAGSWAEVLAGCGSPDAATRAAQERALAQLKEGGLAGYVGVLAEELRRPGGGEQARRLAGLLLKNEASARDERAAQEAAERWMALDAAVRADVKMKVLETLAAPETLVGQTAALVAAKIAVIEMPRGEWLDLVPALVRGMAESTPAGPATSSASASFRLCVLETLGYVCEGIEDCGGELSEADTNQILTAIARGMGASEPSMDVRLAAYRAILHALDFASGSFEREEEQRYLMAMFCEGTQSPDAQLRVLAFECLATVAALYYDILPPYVKDVSAVCCQAVQRDAEEVALQAVEFWSTVAEVERDRGDAGEEHWGLSLQAAPGLVPVLLTTLTKQVELELNEEGAWTLSMAGGACLEYLAGALGDRIVPLVEPFIAENVQQEDWRLREAAMCAFGEIVDGPEAHLLAGAVAQIFPALLQALRDPVLTVRDTAAWALGRIFEFLHGVEIQPPAVPFDLVRAAVAAAIAALEDHEAVAEKACYVLQSVAEGYQDPDEYLEESPLSHFFNETVAALVRVASKPVENDTKVRVEAFNAICAVIQAAPDAMGPTLLQMVPLIAGHLQGTFGGAEAADRRLETQGLLCGALQVLVERLTFIEACKPAVAQHADGVMEVCLRVLDCNNGSVQEEAMRAVGAVAVLTGPDFAKYMPAFQPFLLAGLQNFGEFQVCCGAVELVGDVCRALGRGVLPFCDPLMARLLHALKADDLHRTVKPAVLSCLGDVAMAVEVRFEAYVGPALAALFEAAKATVETAAHYRQDEDMLEYLSLLQDSILQALSCILQGFKDPAELPAPQHAALKGRVLQLLQHPVLVAFLDAVMADEEREEAVTQSALGLLADLAEILEGSEAYFRHRQAAVAGLLAEGKALDSEAVREVARLAEERIGQRLAANAGRG